MRSLQECQAEVFRRSEKRIKARKQRRNRILMVCAPLVLCLALAVVFRFPKGSRGTAVQDGFAGGLTGESYENLSCAIAKITVSGSDFSQTYTDPGYVLRISDQLNSCVIREPESAAENLGSDNSGQKYAAGGIYGDAESSGYTVTLELQGSARRIYYFDGNRLTDLTAEQTYILTREQANQLEDLLGIPRK